MSNLHKQRTEWWLPEAGDEGRSGDRADVGTRVQSFIKTDAVKF